MGKLFTDLKIVDGDIVLQDGAELLVDGVDSIKQDMKHLIIETQLLIGLVGNRDANDRQQKLNQLINRIEADSRIQPGTVVIEQPDIETFYFSMSTTAGVALQLTAKAS